MDGFINQYNIEVCMSKTWKAWKVPVFDVGTIEFHTCPITLQRRLKSAGVDCDLSGTAGMFEYSTWSKNGVWYLGVFDGRFDTLAHECFHAAVRVLAVAGVVLEHDESNEAYAYFLGTLFREFSPVLAHAVSE